MNGIGTKCPRSTQMCITFPTGVTCQPSEHAESVRNFSFSTDVTLNVVVVVGGQFTLNVNAVSAFSSIALLLLLELVLPGLQTLQLFQTG